LSETKQPALFDLGHPDLLPKSQPHSPTSQAAATAIRPDANRLRAAVLEFLRTRGADGATDEDGIEGTGIGPSTFRPRRVELVELAMVKDSGTKRRTKSGRLAAVWIAT
jgi:hypothetical protein